MLSTETYSETSDNPSTSKPSDLYVLKVTVAAKDKRQIIFTDKKTAIINALKFIVHKALKHFDKYYESLDFRDFSRIEIEQLYLKSYYFEHKSLINIIGFDLLMDLNIDNLKEYLQTLWDTLLKDEIPDDLNKCIYE